MSEEVSIEVNPIEKVIQVCWVHKTCDEFAEWREDSLSNLGREIKVGECVVADLSATIQVELVKIVAATSKIDDLSADISADEALSMSSSSVTRKQ